MVGAARRRFQRRNHCCVSLRVAVKRCARWSPWYRARCRMAMLVLAVVARAAGRRCAHDTGRVVSCRCPKPRRSDDAAMR
ncbi:hypothetical protein C6Q03_09005 [Burkholderia multivorans]|nr:hypothetical protein C6Q03_09005 [Burkholderia multivorans]